MSARASARRLLVTLAALAWIGAPFAARHPLLPLAEEAANEQAVQRQARLEMALERLDAELPEEVEVALWWEARDPAGLVALGHLWALSSYELAPRRVYPLLTPEEAPSIEPLDERLRPFLVSRSQDWTNGELTASAVVFAWRDADCRLEDFPRLRRRSSGDDPCLLEPSP